MFWQTNKQTPKQRLQLYLYRYRCAIPPNPARVADAAVRPVIARPEAAVVPVAAVDPPRVMNGNAKPDPMVPAERNVEYTAGTWTTTKL